MRLGPLSYQSAFDLLRAKGYQPVAGSSRFEDERGRTGRIVEAEGRGDTWYAEAEESDTDLAREFEENSGTGTFTEGFAAGRSDRETGHTRQLCTTGTGERPPVVKRQGRDYYHGYKAAAEGATSEPSAHLTYRAKHRGMSGMAANGGSSDLRAGARALVTRQQNAMDRFIEYAMDRAGLSREEAERALAVYRREKVIKLDPMSGQFNFKHGAFGEADVLQRAARMTGNPVHLKLDGNFSFGIGSEDDKAMKKNALGIKNPPPGAEHLVPAGEAGAMVGYLPYLGTAYDVSQSTVSGSVELFFATLAAARKFFDSAVRSGDIEQAELRQDAAGHARGKLIDEFDTPRAYLSEHEPNAAAGHCRICGEHLPPGEVICEHHEHEGLSNDPRWQDLPSWEEARGMAHGGKHGLVENAKRQAKSMEDATALIPEVVADAVIGEVESYVGGDGSLRQYADELADRARAIYGANADFAKKLRRESGRETLYSFMRHWLASLLKKKRPDVFARLPRGYGWERSHLRLEHEANATGDNPMTVRLPSGVEVLAKLYKGEPESKKFSNRTQAERAVAEAGPGWTIWHPHRIFYVARVSSLQGQTPNWGLMLDLGGVERRLGASRVAAVLADLTPHAVALGLANDALDANDVKQHEAYTSLARMIDDGDLDDLIRAAKGTR